MTLQERIARCDREIAHCHANACDSTLTEVDRRGATMGEADWTSEKMRLEKLMGVEAHGHERQQS